MKDEYVREIELGEENHNESLITQKKREKKKGKNWELKTEEREEIKGKGKKRVFNQSVIPYSLLISFCIYCGKN